MRRLHWYVGVATLIAFVGTGAYMRLALDGLEQHEPGARMLIRSRHIYLLAAGLVHLALGSYCVPAARGWRARVQFAGSLLLIAAPLLLFWAFASEPGAGELGGPWSRLGIAALAVGSVAHAVSAKRG